MALSDGNMGPADIAAVMGSNGFGGFGGWNNGDFWLILILLFAFGGFGGWGGNMGGGYGAGAMGGMMYPWMNQLEYTQAGFAQQSTNTALGNISDAVNSGFAGVNTSLCNGFAGVNQNLSNGFAGVNQSVANGFAQAEIADNARQIANMQQAFNAQTATTGAINGVQSQLAQCCCNQSLNACQTQNTIQNEGNATRFADANNTRDIITNQTANTQAILDKLCQLELDGVRGQLDAERRENVSLQNQLNMAQFAASNNAQTAAILTDNLAQTNALEQYLAPVPRPAYIVPSPACCNQNYGYGCGCGM